MADRPLFPHAAFHPAPGTAHVCAASESLPLRNCKDALIKYMNDKAARQTGREDQTQYLDDVRRLISQAWNVSFNEVGFAPSVAHGVSTVLESLSWKEDDNVCVHADEFPSLVGPFALRQQQRQQASSSGASKTSPIVRYCQRNNVKDIVNSKTRLIAVSYVSYLDSRIDLSFYRELADSVGAIFLVDFTQAAGYAPIDASIADFAFSACYQWLLGTTGVTIAYWNHKRMQNWKPSTGGWHSLSLGAVRPKWETIPLEVRNDAMCFSHGNPAHLPIYILRECLEFLNQWDPNEILDHVEILTSTLLQRLQWAGISPATPIQKAAHGASVIVYCAGASEIVKEMEKAGVYAWNGQGRVHFSF